MNIPHRIILAVWLGYLFVPCAWAQKLPKWELGVGVGGVSLPIYRGAKPTKNLWAPWPLIRYRGERFSIDEAGAHGWLYASDTMKLDVSLAGGLPVAKGDSGLREGMPGLDTTLEFGPNLEINLWKSASQALSMDFPLRATVSVDLQSVNYQGWVFAPYLHYYVRPKSKSWWVFQLTFGPQFADSQYHNYYYGVAKQYGTSSRPHFNPDGGYSGSRLNVYIERSWGDVWLLAFARYDFLHDAAFSNSPLVETKAYYILGFAVSWIFAKSNKLVETLARDRF